MIYQLYILPFGWKNSVYFFNGVFNTVVVYWRKIYALNICKSEYVDEFLNVRATLMMLILFTQQDSYKIGLDTKQSKYASFLLGLI